MSPKNNSPVPLPHQCAGCLRHHKLVDNLGLVLEYDLQEETNVKLDTD